MGRGAWQAVVSGVTQRLKWLSMHASTCLEEEQAAFGCWSHDPEMRVAWPRGGGGARGMWTDWRFSLEIRDCFPHLPCLVCLCLCLFCYLWRHFLKVDLIYCCFVTAVFMNNFTWYWIRFLAVHWTVAIAYSYPVSREPKRSLIYIYVCVWLLNTYIKKNFLLNVFKLIFHWMKYNSMHQDTFLGDIWLLRNFILKNTHKEQSWKDLYLRYNMLHCPKTYFLFIEGGEFWVHLKICLQG